MIYKDNKYICKQQQLPSGNINYSVPPTSTDTSVFIRNLRALYGYTETTLYYTEDLQSACTGPPSASGRKRLRATSPAWCQCSSCSTFVGASGDGMQEPPNESDASVSTLIIVFGSYAVVFYIYLYCLFGYGYWVKIY